MTRHVWRKRTCKDVTKRVNGDSNVHKRKMDSAVEARLVSYLRDMTNMNFGLSPSQVQTLMLQLCPQFSADHIEYAYYRLIRRNKSALKSFFAAQVSVHYFVTTDLLFV